MISLIVTGRNIIDQVKASQILTSANPHKESQLL